MATRTGLPEIQALTVAAAARELNASDQSVYRWLAEGRLKSFEGVQGGITLVDAASVATLKAQRAEEASQ